MKRIIKIAAMLLVLLMLIDLCGSPLSTSVLAAPASTKLYTEATGYTSAEDVEYLSHTGSYFDPEKNRNVTKTILANWGARGEDCVFLSSYAEDYYTGDYQWEALTALQGGTGISNAYTSDLYLQLQQLMTSTHAYYTEYTDSKNVRDFYAYTDCLKNDVSKVSLLYRCTTVSSTWDQGTTWNQEHVWPKSKLSTDYQIGDLMHLRPANPSENSSRSNKAYGKSSGYYNPGPSVRGDCARMVLYMYVRWGTTDTMWGSEGVMENLSVLLAWMEEDPVDTWEMGRNDSVQSITGVRNVFVDYPELAWLLFGREVPEDMTTPSSQEDAVCTHENTELRKQQDPTCIKQGYTGDTYCADCGEWLCGGEIISATGHSLGDWYVYSPSTSYEPGEERRDCQHCDYYESNALSLLGDANGDGVVDTSDAKLVLKYELGVIGTEGLNVDVVDLNGDGIIDSTDAKRIMWIELQPVLDIT